MKKKYGFTLMSASEFEAWIKQQNVARTINYIQEHHTFVPSYSHFSGDNHLELQRNMRNHHVNNNGWSDIGQHFSIFPDGKVATGRSLERSPACIKGNNSHSICIENVGYFDVGKDVMRQAQKDSIVKVTAALCKRFNIEASSDNIVYHHWFDLDTGARTNGRGITKSCPGTDFFGGNTVADCKNNFLPLVKNAINGAGAGMRIQQVVPMKYAYVTAHKLNIRKGARSSFAKIGQTSLGAVLRIYKEKNNWYKISHTKEEWVYGNYVKDVKVAKVKANVLNVRSGPSVNFNKVGALLKEQKVFVYEEENNWARISLGEQWLSKKFLDFND